jgi:hypothetical protein
MTVFRIKGASGAVANRSYRLGDRTVVGRADDCDVRVDVDGIAPHHFAIVVDEGSVASLEVLPGADGIQLNGQTVMQAALSSGDEIRVAACRWVLQAPGLRPERALTDSAEKPALGIRPWAVAAWLLLALAGAGAAALYFVPEWRALLPL